jgi:hypothetical protein
MDCFQTFVKHTLRHNMSFGRTKRGYWLLSGFRLTLRVTFQYEGNETS